MPRWRWILLLVSLFAGCVLLPVAAYVIGGRFAGPYAGPRGLASYFGAIYADAARGQPIALLMILGPALCMGVWGLRAWLLGSVVRADPEQQPDHN